MQIRTTPPLKPVNHDLKTRAWCGPTVVSAITGAPTSQIKKVVQVFRGCIKPVQGVGNDELMHTLSQLGYGCGPDTLYRHGERPTLASWLRGRTFEQRRQTFVIRLSCGRRSGWFGGLSTHWVVVRANTFLDTFTDGQPVAIGKAPHRRKRVVSAFPVWKEEERPATTSAAPLRKAAVGRRTASVESRV